MSTIHTITDAMAPAIGTIRDAGPDDLIYVLRSATSRKDWPRYWDALGVAFARGAFVHVMNGGETK
ncbi:hypothetical protein ACWCO0_09525 [Streptomyces tubercidicus]